MLDSRLKKAIEMYEQKYGKLSIVADYRDFNEQLKLFNIGRDIQEYYIEKKLLKGKRLQRLADSGKIEYPRVTNATPGTSPHNFGMAIDVLKDGDIITDRLNQVYGENIFVNGRKWGDVNHIEIVDFKLPKYEYRWSKYFSPKGYEKLKKMGALND